MMLLSQYGHRLARLWPLLAVALLAEDVYRSIVK